MPQSAKREPQITSPNSEGNRKNDNQFSLTELIGVQFLHLWDSISYQFKTTADGERQEFETTLPPHLVLEETMDYKFLKLELSIILGLNNEKLNSFFLLKIMTNLFSKSKLKVQLC